MKTTPSKIIAAKKPIITARESNFPDFKAARVSGDIAGAVVVDVVDAVELVELVLVDTPLVGAAVGTVDVDAGLIPEGVLEVGVTEFGVVPIGLAGATGVVDIADGALPIGDIPPGLTPGAEVAGAVAGGTAALGVPAGGAVIVDDPGVAVDGAPETAGAAVEALSCAKQGEAKPLKVIRLRANVVLTANEFRKKFSSINDVNGLVTGFRSTYRAN